MIKFNCANCGQRISTSDDDAGTEGACPGCAAAVIVPNAHEALAEPVGPVEPSPGERGKCEPPPLPRRSKEQPRPIPRAPLSRTQRQLLFFAVALCFFGIVHVFNAGRDALRERRREKATAVLRPIVDGLTPKLSGVWPEKPQALLRRPFVVYYLGGSLHSPFAAEHGVLDAYVDIPDPKTVILLRDKEIESEMFSIMKLRRGLKSDGTEIVYRHAYELWAVDLSTQTIVAHFSGADAPLTADQAVQQRKSAGRSRPAASWPVKPYEGWGNAVTMGTPRPARTPTGLAKPGSTPAG